MRALSGFVAAVAALTASSVDAQAVTFPPPDISTLMPRSEAEATIISITSHQAQMLTDITMAQSALISLQTAGVREFTVATNCQVGDRMVMTPASPLPSGFMLGDIVCTAAGTATAKLYMPPLGLGVSYNITAKVMAFR